MPAEYTKPNRNSSSRAQVKSSAAAVKPLITKLYEGTAELRISIPQNRMADEPSVQKEIIAITLPSAGKHADEHACIASLISSLTMALLDDCESAKRQTRKAVQAAGISRARAAGTHFGKQRMDFDADLFAAVCRAYAGKEITADAAGERLGCSARTFRRRYADAYPANSEKQTAEIDGSCSKVNCGV